MSETNSAWLSSVMMDGLMADMKTPASYEYNVDVTKRTVDMAHHVEFQSKETWMLRIFRNGYGWRRDGSGAEGAKKIAIY